MLRLVALPPCKLFKFGHMKLDPGVNRKLKNRMVKPNKSHLLRSRKQKWNRIHSSYQITRDPQDLLLQLM